MEGNIMESTLTMNTDRPTDKINTKVMENINNEEHTQTQTLYTNTNTHDEDLEEKEFWRRAFELAKKYDDEHQEPLTGETLQMFNELMQTFRQDRLETIIELYTTQTQEVTEDDSTTTQEEVQLTQVPPGKTIEMLEDKQDKEEKMGTDEQETKQTDRSTVNLLKQMEANKEMRIEDTLSDTRSSISSMEENIYNEGKTQPGLTLSLKKQEDTKGETTNKEHKMTGSTHIHGQGHIDITESDTESRPTADIVAYNVVNRDTEDKDIMPYYIKDCTKTKKFRKTTNKHYTKKLVKFKHRWRRKEA